MLHHLSFGTPDLERAAAFYDAALPALGYRRVFTANSAVGYGIHDGQDPFCLKRTSSARPPGDGCHLAFAAPDRAAVDAFHASALAAGGTDDGPPGLREHYGPTYYAAFVIDLDGYRLEAVTKAD